MARYYNTYRMTPAERRARAQRIVQYREERSMLNKYLQEKEEADKLMREREAARLSAENKEKERREVGFLGRGLATVGDLLANVSTGAVKSLEGIADLGLGVVGGIGGIFDDDFEDSIKDIIAKDWTGTYIGEPLQEALRYSYLKDGGIVENVASGLGQMLPAVAVTIATGGAGAPAAVAQAASLATTMAGAAGNATEEAFKEGADYWRGLGYGVASGAVEGATEKLLGGATSKIFGAGMLDGVVRSVAGEVAETGVRRVLKDAAGEAFEEGLAELVNPALKSIYKGRDAFSEYGEADYWKGVGESALVGGLTSVAFGGTVGRAMKTSGKYADISGSLEANDNIAKERRSLEKRDRLSPEAEASSIRAERQNLLNIEKVLKRSNETQRQELFDRFKLDSSFESDGSIKESVIKRLEAMEKGDGRYRKEYYSVGMRGNEAMIEEDLKAISERTGVEAKVFDRELSETGKKNFTKTKKALAALNDSGGNNVSFVITEANEAYKGGLVDDKVIYIPADQLESDDWAGTLVHEFTHFEEGTDEYNEMFRFLQSDEILVDDGAGGKVKLWESARDAVLAKGYVSDVEQLDAVIGKANTEGVKALSKSEYAVYTKYTTELAAHETEMIMGNEGFIDHIIRTDEANGIVKRILMLDRALSSMKDKQARAQAKLIKEAERLYLKAAESAGNKRIVKMILAQDPELEDELTRMNEEKMQVGEKSVQMDLKDYAEYDKPITLNDINILRSIERKSVNAFSLEDIKRARKWAYRFKDLKTKSPFFRAWFGDWRANDIKTPSYITDIPQGVDINQNRREVVNEDTGWNVTLTEDIVEDSLHYAVKDRLYIERLLTHIDEVLKKAILLDTAISDTKKNNKKGSSQFMHYLYAPIEYQGAPFLAKITIEEYDVDNKKRAYNAQRIKLSTLSRAQYSQLKAAYRGNYASSVDAISIADLVSLVKTFDKDFTPAPEVHEKMLNEDGTPKVFYHGTRKENGEFWEFDYTKAKKKGGLGFKSLGQGNYFTSHKLDGTELYGSRVIEAYLSIRTPLVMEQGSNFKQEASKVLNRDMSQETYPSIQQAMRDAGYDGVILLDENGDAAIAVTFDSEQSKSVTENIGTYSKYEKDIRFNLKEDHDLGDFFGESDKIKRLSEQLAAAEELEEIQKKAAPIKYKPSLMLENGNMVSIDTFEKRAREQAAYAGFDPMEVDFKMDGSEYVAFIQEGDVTLDILRAEREYRTEDDKRKLKQLEKRADFLYKYIDQRNEIPDEYSERQTLVEAMELIVSENNQYEKNLLKEYKENIDQIEKNEIELIEVREKIKKIRYTPRYILDSGERISRKSFQKKAKEYAVEQSFDEREVSFKINDDEYIAYVEDGDSEKIVLKAKHDPISDQEKEELLSLEKKEKELSMELKKQDRKLLSIEYAKPLKEYLSREALEAYRRGKEKGKVVSGEYKEKFFAEIKRNKTTNHTLYKVKKLKDLKTDAFLNASEHKPHLFKGSIEKLAAIETRGNLNKSGTRRIVAELAEWYVRENPMLKENNLFDEEVEGMLYVISHGKGQLSTDEISMLGDIVSYFSTFVQNYNKVYRNGKYEDAKPIAERYIKTMVENGKVNVGFINKITGSKYLRIFGDPMTVMRRMDLYESGFYTEMMEQLREGAIGASVMEMKIREPLEKFFEKNKKFLQEIRGHKIKYEGFEMTSAQAMLYYMTLNRKQALAGLAKSGFAYIDDNNKTVRVPGFLKTEGMDTATLEQVFQLENLTPAAKAEQAKIYDQLTAAEKQYISLAEKIFNEDCKNAKREMDMRRKGFSNALEDYYVPIRRGNIAKSVDAGTFFDEMNRASNASFNKDTVRGAKNELFIESLDNVLDRHIRGVSQYANLATVIDAYDTIFNLAVNDDPNKPDSVRTVSENVWREGAEYFKDVISDIQGIPAESRREGYQLIRQLRSGYAKYQLGANPKVWFTQLSSFCAAMSILDVDSITKGFSIDAKDVDEWCALAKLRNSENTVAAAQGLFDEHSKPGKVLEATGKFGDVLMTPIGWVDRFVVTKLFGACQVQVAKNGGAKVGTQANKKAAGELLQKVILETQQNATATDRSAAMRSGNELMKTITMFTADSMKVMGRVIDSVGEVSVLKARLKTAAAEERTKLETRLKAAEKQARRSIASLVSSAAFMAVIAQLFRTLYNKDEEDDNIALNMVVDAAGNMIGGLPGIKDVYGFFADGYGLDNYAYSAINDLFESARDIMDVTGAAFSGDLEGRELASSIKKMSYAAGQVLGLPTRNAYNVVYGLTKRVSPSTAYKIDDAFYNQSYRADLTRAIERGDDKMIATIAGLMLNENVGGIEDPKSRQELDRLITAGFDIIPRATASSITYDGEEYVLDASDRKDFEKIYTVGNEVLADLVKMSKYQSASDEVKAAAISYIYKVYWDLAVQELVGEDLETKTVLFAEAIDIEKLALIVATASSIKADTDKNGKTVSGSRKKKVQEYVNSLELKAVEKYMIMGYLGYKNSKGEAQVKAYINKLKLTKWEKEKLIIFSGY